MTIQTTDWAMTSDRTPEHAYRAGGTGAAAWRLSWLPDRRLTHAQALAGMELDELLSDPAAIHRPDTATLVADRAAVVGVRYEHAVILLSRRMVERMRRHAGLRPRRDGESVLAGRTRPDLVLGPGYQN